MNLPSQYIECTGIYPLNNSYIDTGITASSNVSVNALFGAPRKSTIFLFGARNTNSTSSAGQFAFYQALNATSYWCYGNVRTSISSSAAALAVAGPPYSHIFTENNYMELYRGGEQIVVPSTSSVTTSFTGTRTIHLFGLNNAGSNTWGQCWLFGFRANDNGNVHDFVPCYDTSTSNYGVYDTYTQTFLPLNSAQTLYLITLNSDGNGDARFSTLFGESLSSTVYGYNASNEYGDVPAMGSVKLIAHPKEGYVFKNWTEGSTIISTEQEFYYLPTADTTITANFAKETKVSYDTNYTSLSLLYGAGQYSRNSDTGTAFVLPSLRNDIFCKVLGGNIVKDSLQKATSTIEVDKVPSALKVKTPIFVFSPKGKCVYEGIVWNIDGNVITCREPMSMFDEDFVLLSTSASNRDIRFAFISNMLSSVSGGHGVLSDYDNLSARKGNNLSFNYTYTPVLEYPFKYVPSQVSISETSVINLEDYLINRFAEFGIGVRAKLIEKAGSYYDGAITTNFDRHLMHLTTFFIYDTEPVVVSDNVENISDVSISIEDSEFTILGICNSAGALQNFYTLDNNGSVVKYKDLASVYPDVYYLRNTIGFKTCNVKLVLSDEKPETLVYQYLTNAKYNHKITFTLYLDGSLLDIDSFKLGRLANFYYKDQLYESVVTGLQFDINENNKINFVRVTLGNVRISLTSKINKAK